MKQKLTPVFLIVTTILCSQTMAQHHHDAGLLGGVTKVGAYTRFIDFPNSIVIGQGIEYEITSSYNQGVDEEIAWIEADLLYPFSAVPEFFMHIFSPPVPAHDPNHGSEPEDRIVREFSISIVAEQTGETEFAYESARLFDVNAQEHQLIVSSLVSSVTLVVRKPGDASGDGEVDFEDFLILSNAFDLDARMAGYEGGDFNLNGEIDFGDFLILSVGWGT